MFYILNVVIMTDIKNEFNKYYINVIQNHYVDFDGKVTKKEFWMFILFNFLIAFVLLLIWNLLHLWVLYTIYSLWVTLPSLGMIIRRLHDIGKSWWWILIEFIPVIWFIWLIVLLVSDSKKVAENSKPETNNVENL